MLDEYDYEINGSWMEMGRPKNGEQSFMDLWTGFEELEPGFSIQEYSN